MTNLTNVSSMTKMGQVTVPPDVRAMLGLKPGDHVRFVTAGEHVYVEKTASLDTLFGIVKARKAATLEAMEFTVEFGRRKRTRLNANTDSDAGGL